jgi:hypothetical protein
VTGSLIDLHHNEYPDSEALAAMRHLTNTPLT